MCDCCIGRSRARDLWLPGGDRILGLLEARSWCLTKTRWLGMQRCSETNARNPPRHTYVDKMLAHQRRVSPHHQHPDQGTSHACNQDTLQTSQRTPCQGTRPKQGSMAPTVGATSTRRAQLRHRGVAVASPAAGYHALPPPRLAHSAKARTWQSLAPRCRKLVNE